MTTSWTGRLGLALFAFTAVAGASQAAQVPVSGGPKELLITYRADPANRPASRAYLQGEGIATLRKLKQDGVLKSCQILFNPFVQPGTWDALTLLTFNRFEDTARWQDLERTQPGGLTPAGLKLAKPSGTYSADLEWEGSAADPGPVADHAFYIIPYTYKTADQYRAYVNGYVDPHVEGWIKEGVLSRYRIFMNRYPVGDPEPWDSLFVYDYRDLSAFGRRDEVTAKVRAPLRQDPTWKSLNDIKSTIRSEAENTIAGFLAAC